MFSLKTTIGEVAPNKKSFHKMEALICDPEGTRTLDLLRDRQAF